MFQLLSGSTTFQEALKYQQHTQQANKNLLKLCWKPTPNQTTKTQILCPLELRRNKFNQNHQQCSGV